MGGAELKPAFYATLASGGTLLAMLSFIGAVWPHVEDPEVWFHLSGAIYYCFNQFLFELQIFISRCSYATSVLVIGTL